MKTARTLRPKSGDRIEKFCEYCGRVERTELQVNRYGRSAVKLTAQPDGTITCRPCGRTHNHKHQNPRITIPTGPTPIQIANQQRREEAAAKRDSIMNMTDAEIDRLMREIDQLAGI